MRRCIGAGAVIVGVVDRDRRGNKLSTGSVRVPRRNVVLHEIEFLLNLIKFHFPLPKMTGWLHRHLCKYIENLFRRIVPTPEAVCCESISLHNLQERASCALTIAQVRKADVLSHRDVARWLVARCKVIRRHQSSVVVDRLGQPRRRIGRAIVDLRTNIADVLEENREWKVAMKGWLIMA